MVLDFWGKIWCSGSNCRKGLNKMFTSLNRSVGILKILKFFLFGSKIVRSDPTGGEIRFRLFAVKVRKTKKIQILIGFLCKMMSSNVELEFERPWPHQIVRNKAVWNAWTAI